MWGKSRSTPNKNPQTSTSMDDVRGFYPDVMDDFAGILIHLDGEFFRILIDFQNGIEWTSMNILTHQISGSKKYRIQIGIGFETTSKMVGLINRLWDGLYLITLSGPVIASMVN